MIRYKIVKNDRSSTNHYTSHRLYYEKNSIVKKIEGTSGIFVFKTRKYAENYKIEHLNSRYKILRVVGFGKGRSVSLCLCLSRKCGEIPKKQPKYSHYDYQQMGIGFLTYYHDIPCWVCPEGTMIYDSVKVLN